MWSGGKGNSITAFGPVHDYWGVGFGFPEVPIVVHEWHAPYGQYPHDQLSQLLIPEATCCPFPCHKSWNARGPHFLPSQEPKNPDIKGLFPSLFQYASSKATCLTQPHHKRKQGTQGTQEVANHKSKIRSKPSCLGNK